MKINIKLFYLIFILNVCAPFENNAYAQSGTIDSSFGVNGKVTTSFGSYDDVSYAMKLQNDGKIVLSGSSKDSSMYYFALARYKNNGEIDSTFDFDGKILTQVGTSDADCIANAIQNDGKILAAGRCKNGNDYEFAVVRYNVDGSLDSTFDFDGKVNTNFANSYDAGQAVAIQNDGKIVVAGVASNGSNYDFALARYNINGSLDSSFDGDGKLITPIGQGDDICNSVAIQNDGKIVVGGYSDYPVEHDFVLVRYDSNGTLDNSFDTDGKVVINVGNSHDNGLTLAIQNDGKILLAGASANLPTDIAVVRCNTDGSLDNTFDTDGKVTTSICGSDVAYSIAIQADNKILTGGSCFKGGNYDFELTRFNTNGSLDSTFDTDGKVLTNILTDSSDKGYSIALQSDGKIIISGYSSDNLSKDFAMVRFNNTPLQINELDNQDIKILICPHPIVNMSTIQLETSLENGELSVYNLFGEKVKKITDISGQKILFERDNLLSGIYLIILTQNNKTYLKQMILIANE